MEPWQSWLAALTVGGACYWYYSQGDHSRQRGKGPRPTPSSEQLNAKQRQDKQAPRRPGETTNRNADSSSILSEMETPQSASKASKKRKAGKPLVKEPDSSVQVQDAAPEVDEADEADEAADYDEREWAAQLQARKTGVDLTASNESKDRAKAQKQALGASTSSSQLAPPDDGFETVGSKKSGQSSPRIPSPSRNREQSAVSGDVSDMLEAAAPGPSIIRITGEEKPKKQHTPQPVPQTETKKQRQRRRKNEEAKQQREEDEKQRQILLENQRRTAREARGEPARNGMARPPTSSAWSKPNQTSSQGSASSYSPPLAARETGLLDTFEHDAASTTSSNDLHTNTTTPATAASMYEQDVPSEEAQMEMLNRITSDSGWSEVTKGRKGKKKAQGLTTPSEDGSRDGSYFAGSSSQPAANGSAKSVAPSASQNGDANGYAALAEKDADQSSQITGHPMDSDWAVF